MAEQHDVVTKFHMIKIFHIFELSCASSYSPVRFVYGRKFRQQRYMLRTELMRHQHTQYFMGKNHLTFLKKASFERSWISNRKSSDNSVIFWFVSFSSQFPRYKLLTIHVFAYVLVRVYVHVGLIVLYNCVNLTNAHWRWFVQFYTQLLHTKGCLLKMCKLAYKLISIVFFLWKKNPKQWNEYCQWCWNSLA